MRLKAERIHSWHQRTFRDLNFGSNPGFMIYKYRKIKCLECGSIKVEQLFWRRILNNTG
jgi:transposase